MEHRILDHIELSRIDEGDRRRTDYGDLEELIESIKERGIVQPIAIEYLREPVNSCHYRIYAGGRRYRAAKEAGLTHIPALIFPEGEELDLREIELLENIQREDMRWDEVALLTRDIHILYQAKYGKEWSGRATARTIGRSHGGVAKNIELAAAIDRMPELREFGTQREALNKLKELEERIIINAMRKKQEAAHTTEEDEEDEEDDLLSLLQATEKEAEAQAKNEDDKLELKELLAERARLVAKGRDGYRIGDAFEGLRESIEFFKVRQAESPIRFIECDPPFGINLAVKKKQSEGSKKMQEYNEVSADIYKDWLKDLCTLLYQAANPDCWLIFWYGPTWDREVRDALRGAGWRVDDIPAVWVKGSTEESAGSGQTSSPNMYLGRASEFFYVCTKGKPVMKQEGRTNVFPCKPVGPRLKWHPTQKPFALYTEILETLCFKNTVGLVPFLGSGQALRALLEYGMAGYGYDLSEYYRDRFLISLEEEPI